MSFVSLDPTRSDGSLLIALVLAHTLVGVLGKFAGPMPLGVEPAGKSVIGFGIDALGGMGFVLADVGNPSGMLPPQLFLAVALALTATTIIGAVGLRLALSRTDQGAR